MADPALLLDIDGVLVVSWRPVPGAVEAMRDLLLDFRSGSSRTRRHAPVRRSRPALREIGIAVDDDELLTAGVATAAYLREHHPDAPCLVLNDGPLDDLAGIALAGPGQDAAVVVIGSAGPSFSWEALNLAASAVTDGARLVAMHGSAMWRTDAGICVDGGAYVAALERVTGRSAVTIGKPAPAMFEAALAGLGVTPADGVMVGDDLDNDVLAAQSLGLRGVLVRTGKFRPEQLDAPHVQPTAVIDSVVDLPGWLGVGQAA